MYLFVEFISEYKLSVFLSTNKIIFIKKLIIVEKNYFSLLYLRLIPPSLKKILKKSPRQ